jgi:hypothetical protein
MSSKWRIGSTSFPGAFSSQHAHCGLFLRRAIGAAPVNPVQHQAVKLDVQVGGGPEALDQRDCAAVALSGLQPDEIQPMAPHYALHHQQHRRDQLGLRSLKQAQRDQRKGPGQAIPT